MAVDFSSKLLVLAGPLDLPIDDAQTLVAIPALRSSELRQPAPEVPGGSVNELHLHSSRGWVFDATGELCKLAGQTDLAFFYAGRHGASSWCFPIGEEDDPEDVYEYVIGTLLEAEALQKAVEAIDKIFAWSRAHLPILATEHFLGHFADEARIADAITGAQPAGSSRDVWHGEDGDGPWYLFWMLRSAQQLMRNALFNGVPVLYVAEEPC